MRTTVHVARRVASAPRFDVLAQQASPWKLSIDEIEHRISAAGAKLPAVDPARLIEARRAVRELCNCNI